MEIKDVTIQVCNTAKERLVLQIWDSEYLYENNGQLTIKERAQPYRAIKAYLMTFHKPSLTEFEISNLTVHSVIQIIYAPNKNPAPEQLVLEAEQRVFQVDKKLHYISKDIEKTLEVYWTIVRLSFISVKGFSNRIFFFLNPTGEKGFITTEAFFCNYWRQRSVWNTSSLLWDKECVGVLRWRRAREAKKSSNAENCKTISSKP